MDFKKFEDVLMSIDSVCTELDPVLKNVSLSERCDESETILIRTKIQELKALILNMHCLVEEVEQGKEHFKNIQDHYDNLQNAAELLLNSVEVQIEGGLVLNVLDLEENKTENKPNGASLNGETGPVSNPKAKETKSTGIPQIPSLKEDEFTAVPKYMKGRLKLGELNSFIDKFNTTVMTKYRLLKKPRKQLTDNDKKEINAYKELETKDTIGCYFCTSDDIRDLTGLKFTHSTWAMLTILRHCSRVKEIRGPKQIVRYCIN